MMAIDTVLERSFSAVWSGALGLAAHGERSALIVSDASTDPRVARAATVAASRLGHRSFTLVHDPRTTTPLATFGTFPSAAFNEDAIRPYPVLNAAVAASDAVILLTSELALLFNPEFRTALRNSKVAFIPYMDAETAVRLLPGDVNEVEDLASVTTTVAEHVKKARQVRLLSERGTDLRLEVGQYTGNCSAGSFAKAKGFGGLEVLPAGQVAVVPNDRSIEGRLVVEGSLNFPRFERLLEPIILDIRESRVVGISGGHQARQLERGLASLEGSGNPWHVTEFGLGTNRRCSFLGVYGPTEDTHRYGTVSMALGADTHLGGRNSAPCHIDMALEETRVELDGSELLSPKEGFAVGDF